MRLLPVNVRSMEALNSFCAASTSAIAPLTSHRGNLTMTDADFAGSQVWISDRQTVKL